MEVRSALAPSLTHGDDILHWRLRYVFLSVKFESTRLDIGLSDARVEKSSFTLTHQSLNSTSGLSGGAPQRVRGVEFGFEAGATLQPHLPFERTAHDA